MLDSNGNNIGEAFYIQNATSTYTRYLTKFEMWWSGSSTLNYVTLDGNTIFGGTSTASTSPTYATLSSSYVFGTWQYSWFKAYFNSAISSKAITFLKVSFSDGCYVVYGSHS